MAVGFNAMLNSANAAMNVALGNLSLQNNSGSSTNIAIGSHTMQNTTGSNSNIAIGTNALQNNLCIVCFVFLNIYITHQQHSFGVPIVGHRHSIDKHRHSEYHTEKTKTW